MSQSENNRNKLLKISNNKIQGYDEKFMGSAIREMNIASQKCKLQILNKFNLSEENKKTVIDEFKLLQIALEKISKNC